MTCAPNGLTQLVQDKLPVTVWAQRDERQPRTWQLRDDQHSLRVTFLPAALRSVRGLQSDHWFALSIEKIVYSACPVSNVPFVLCAQVKRLMTANNGPPGPPQQHKSSSSFRLRGKRRLPGGHGPIFLKEYASFLSNEELGCPVTAGHAVSASMESVHHTQARVTHFLQRHAAHTVLESTSHYHEAISEFATAQLDRQTASLTNNTAKQETAQQAVQVRRQHRVALERALQQHQQSLTVERLCEWQGIVCQDQRADAGQLRSGSVRVGSTSFGPPNRVRSDLETVCRIIGTLESRLLPDKHVATFAAIVFFAVIDVHGFSDGNGRLARIAMNWALRKGGMPFCVNLFATPAQRQEYLTAIRESRRHMHLRGRNVSKQTMVEAYQCHPVFAPLVSLILSRLDRAVAECEKVCKEKQNLQFEQELARTARRFREEAARGNCLICFEDKPNIATLCCGKAVHLNCIAEWLANNNSCPQCRNEIPQLPESIRSPVRDDTMSDFIADDDDGASTGSATYDEETTSMIFEIYDDTGDDTVEESESENSTTEYQPTVDNHNNETLSDEDENTNSDTEENDDTESTSEENDDTNDDTEANDVLQPVLYCNATHCRNRAARDCANHACGQCCLMTGHYVCPRHSN